MPAYIQNIATAVPEGSFGQPFMREKMKEYVSQRPATRRIIHRLYSNSGIEKRHTVVNDFHGNGQATLFFNDDGALGRPSTKERNDLYAEHAKQLFVDVAQMLVEEQDDVQKKDITHVITASCTGFFAPGPAFEIVKKLELSESTHRFHVGFMGCFAAFPALKMAQAFCEADPDARVLVISVELCSLHLQASDDTDQLISASVFADGASGALVSSQQPSNNQPHYRINKFATSIARDSEEDMAWTIGNTGFDMVLSTYVPQIIETNIAQALTPILDSYSINFSNVENWAIHPGGRAILDKVESELDLSPEQLASSRHVLANYGNMSSATILFVLKKLLENPAQKSQEHTLAMAFGPGLTIESGLFTKLS